MATFSDYYRQMMADLQSSPAPARSAVADVSGVPNIQGGKVEKPPQSPLNWFIDILSRPLFAATTAVGGVLEGVAKSQEEGNPLSAIGGALAIPTNALAGFVANDSIIGEEGTKRTYGDLMEEYTDRFGKLNDPNYVDRPDNVHPSVRGGLGLTLDIAADPLTWIPGGILLKGAGLASRGAKAAVETAGRGVEAARGVKAAEGATEAVSEAVPVGARVADNPLAEEVGSGIRPDRAPGTQMTPDEIRELVGPDVAKIAEPEIQAATKAPKTESAVATSAKVVDPYPYVDVDGARFVDEAAARAYAAEKGRDFLGVEHLPRDAAELKRTGLYDDLFETLDGTAKPLDLAVEGLAKAADGEVKTLRELFNEAPGAQGMIDAVNDIIGRVGAKVSGTAVLSRPEWFKANKSRTLDDIDEGVFDEATGTISGGLSDLVQSKQLSTLLYQGNLPGKKGTIDRLYAIMKNESLPTALRTEAKNVIDAAYAKYLSDAEKPRVAITSIVKAFEDAVKERAAELKSLFGDELYRVLSSKNTDASLQRAFDNILKALRPETDLEKFFNEPGVKRLAQAIQNGLGIPKSVKPTPNTVDEVAALEAATRSAEEGLNEVGEAMAKTLHSEVTEWRVKYPFYDKQKKAWFDSNDKAKRVGRHRKILNTGFQYTLYKNLRAARLRRIQEAKGKPVDELVSKSRAMAERDALLSLGDDLMRVIQGLGTKMHIGVRDDLLPITFPEVYRIVEQGFKNSDEALLALHNGGSMVPFTQLMWASHVAILAGDLTRLSKAEMVALREELTKIVLSKETPYGHALPNNLAKGGNGFMRGGKNPAVEKLKPGQLAGPLVDAIIRKQPELVATTVANQLAWAERGLAEAAKLSNAEVKALQGLIESGAYKSAIVAAVDGIPESVAKAGTELATTDNAVAAATEMATKTVGDAEVQFAKTQAKLADDVKKSEKAPKGKKKKARKKAVEKGSQKAADDVGRQVDETAAEKFDEINPAPAADEVEDIPALDLSGALPVFAQQGFVARMLNGLNEAFNQTKGMARVWPAWHAKRTVAGQYLERKVSQIRDFNKFPREIQIAAVKAVQSGARNVNPEIAAATAQAEQIMKGFWNLTNDAATGRFLDHQFLAVEPNIGHINAILDMKGVPKPMRFDEAAESLDDLLDSWRQWDITDPADFFVKMADAAATVAEHRAFVGNFVYTFRKIGLVSNEYKPGFVRIAASDRSTFAGLMPEGIFVERNLANELHRLDIITRADRKMKGEIQQFLTNYYIPAQAIWKSLVTVWRPGHHVRNFNSNGFMQWVARGNRDFVSSQKDALKVLGVRNDYPELDIVASLKSIGDEALPVGGDVIIGGRFNITSDELLRIFNDNGLRTSHTVSEDLFLDSLTQSRVTQAANKLNASRPGQTAGHVSQFVDHYGKMAHFIQILKQESKGVGQWGKTLPKDEVIRRAVREVKRSHPDANMLTPTESKYRWIIPFYTWFAKTMPFAIESAARNPHRIAFFPKASYNLGVAMGVNPDSLIDPFPTDQLFPSYITEGFFGPQFVGPDGQYVNVNPGVQHFDLFREIGADPIRGMVGMTSPLLRMPVEMLSGGQMATGARINDTSDYIDQNLPLINYLANVTGVSPSGSIGTLLTGQGLDPQNQVARGNKTEFDRALSFLNFFAGANAQNWSRPNIVNYAEIEKRNRAAEEGK